MAGASQARRAAAASTSEKSVVPPQREVAQDPESARAVARRAVTAGSVGLGVVDEAGHVRARLEGAAFATAKMRQRAAELDQRIERAAVDLLGALEALLDDESVWSRLGSQVEGWEQLSSTQVHALREVLAHDLPALLVELGYQPPPAVELWTTWVQDSLAALVDGRAGDAAHDAHVAEWELRCFVVQLRALVDVQDVRAADAARRDKDRRARVLSALADGGRKAVAVGLATATSVGVATVVGAADPVSAATLMGTSTAKAAEAFVGYWGTRASMSSPRLTASQSVEAADEALRVWLTNAQGDEETHRRTLFLVRRGLYGVLAELRTATAYDDDELWRLISTTLRQCEERTFDRAGLIAFREDLDAIGVEA